MESIYENKIILAPMSNHNDPAFIRICLDFGADRAVSGLISCHGLHHRNRKTFELIRQLPDLELVAVQLFGSIPAIMERGTRSAADAGARSLDLNLGCPARKILKSRSGSALTRDLGLAREVMQVMRRATDLPLSAKFRLGPDEENLNYIAVGELAQETGFDAVCLHPRTAAQAYAGRADWSHIGTLRRALDIPVIANGDIVDADSARRAVDETGCSSIMVGRAAVERPWIFRELQWALRGRGEPCGEDTSLLRIDMAVRHLEMLDALFGVHGVRMARSRIARYLKTLPDASIIRHKLNRLQDKQEVLKLLSDYREAVSQNGGQ